MALILVTLAVFHEPMFWLNDVAKLNIMNMFAILDVSHELIGSLNVEMLKNNEFMSVIRVVTMLLNGTDDDSPRGLNSVFPLGSLA